MKRKDKALPVAVFLPAEQLDAERSLEATLLNLEGVEREALRVINSGNVTTIDYEGDTITRNRVRQASERYVLGVYVGNPRRMASNPLFMEGGLT